MHLNYQTKGNLVSVQMLSQNYQNVGLWRVNMYRQEHKNNRSLLIKSSSNPGNISSESIPYPKYWFLRFQEAGQTSQEEKHTSKKLEPNIESHQRNFWIKNQQIAHFSFKISDPTSKQQSTETGCENEMNQLRKSVVFVMSIGQKLSFYVRWAQ